MTEEKLPINEEKRPLKWLVPVSWIGTVLILAGLVSILFWQPRVAKSMAELKESQESVPVIVSGTGVPREALLGMPEYNPTVEGAVIVREPETHTEVKGKLRSTAVEYTVEQGDAIFRIATRYDISPETLLWANYDILQDNVHFLDVGQTLTIPPTNGIWYEWKENDTLQSVADKYKADVNDIKLWFGNEMDLTNPVVTAGTKIMIPGGEREMQQWVVPTIAVGRSGTISTIEGPGSCTLTDYGLFGSGYFSWPADNHYLSGNDYWSGHLAIDIAAGQGAPIYAADSGLVVYAGWISGGYGNMIMIDHGNGYQTLYAHLSALATSCGNSVYQGQTIGYSGMTGGTSTGPHLHFEIRYLGGFVNPWYYMP